MANRSWICRPEYIRACSHVMYPSHSGERRAHVLYSSSFDSFCLSFFGIGCINVVVILSIFRLHSYLGSNRFQGNPSNSYFLSRGYTPGTRTPCYLSACAAAPCSLYALSTKGCRGYCCAEKSGPAFPFPRTVSRSNGIPPLSRSFFLS